jgi:two-component system phosphate regulon sensor histidine kinase PhoR
VVRSRSAFVRGIRQLLGREFADPRFAQTLFLIPVFADLLFVSFHGSSVLPTEYVGGLAVAAFSTTLAMFIGRRTEALDARYSALVPLLDIAALGLMRLDAESTSAAFLVLPAIWLGLQFGRRGVLIAVVVGVAALGLPLLVHHEPAAEVARGAVQLLLAVLCGFVVSVTAELWQTKVAQAADAQRMLERAVSDSADQRRFNEAILDSVDVGLLALDARGEVHSINPRHRRFLESMGWSDGILDQVGRTFGPDGLRALSEQELPTWRAVHGETLRDYLIWVGDNTSDRRAFAVSVSPFFTAEGVFDGAVLAYHDITELMTAARLKDEFVATVSHELRTPLTSIVGYVDLLLEDVGGLAPDAQAFLQIVQRNARRLHRLVDDLLSDTLKLGRAELHLGRISLAGVVRASAVEAAKAADQAGLGFEMQIGRPLLEVQGDAERLAQVIDNIFNNAIKFTAAGGMIIGSVRSEGREAVVRIADTGRGIPPDELEDVFMKFFRSPGVQLDAIPGTGLGLAISKTIIEAHGGAISIASSIGEGTALEIRLPLSGPKAARRS